MSKNTSTAKTTLTTQKASKETEKKIPLCGLDSQTESVIWGI